MDSKDRGKIGNCQFDCTLIMGQMNKCTYYRVLLSYVVRQIKLVDFKLIIVI